MTDWDKLEGVALDLALAQLTSGEKWTPVTYPPYHRSVDASIRDLVPLLGPEAEFAMMNRKEPNAWAGCDSLMLYYADGSSIATAFARALGKALEARRD